MARLRTTRRTGELRIALSGRLTAGDMGRLEHACAEALTRELLRLQLDLTGVTEIDRTASALLSSLERRGAVVLNPRIPRDGI